MERRIYRSLAVRLLLSAAVLSVLMGSLVYFLEMRDVDRMVGQLAEAETRRGIGSVADALRAPGPEQIRDLQAAAGRLVEGGFLAAELYDRDHRMVVEAGKQEASNVAEEADEQPNRFPRGEEPVVRKLWTKGRLVLEVMFPLKGSDGARAGYFEGLYAVDPPTFKRIMMGVGSSVLIVVLAVVATAATLYPVVLRLNRRLIERSRDLAQSNRELSEANAANQAKTDFLANMSHELRSPLNAVIGFSDIMAEKMFGPVGNPRYEEYVRDINESGRHLLDLINDILDLSKVEAGKLELAEGPVDVEALVNGCRRLVAERAGRAGVRLGVEADPAIACLRGDGRKLKQVIINLLTNAIKFTPEGGDVALRVYRSPDGEAVFEVADSGIGIAEADIPKVLQPFGQADDPLVRSQEGTGLGLPLSKRLVELHGGTLSIRPGPGRGTVVAFTLPVERVMTPGPDCAGLPQCGPDRNCPGGTWATPSPRPRRRPPAGPRRPHLPSGAAPGLS